MPEDGIDLEQLVDEIAPNYIVFVGAPSNLADFTSKHPNYLERS